MNRQLPTANLPQPTDSPDHLIETAIQSLRLLWLGQSVAQTRQHVLVSLRKLQMRAGSSNQLEAALKDLATDVEHLPQDDDLRKHAVQTIAANLNALRPLLGGGIAPAPTETGKLNTAIRTPKPRKPAAPVPVAAPAAPPAPVSLQLDNPVDMIPGIGPSGAKLLANLGVHTVGELLRHTPRNHIDYANPRKIADIPIPTGWVVYRGILRSVKEIYGKGKSRVEAVLRDDTGSIKITWFSTYIARQIAEGDEIVVRGTVKSDRFGFSLSPIEWEKADYPDIVQGKLTPIYPLTKGLAQKRLRGWMHRALEASTPNIRDWMGELRSITNQVMPNDTLLPLDQAYRQLHFPDSWESHGKARDRLAFEIYLLLQIGLIERKAQAKAEKGVALPTDPELIADFRTTLPFSLTGAQDRALDQILRDIAQGIPMTRLLQGDVGTGKTVVAAIAALTARHNGYQTAVMAPTEILAEQHFRSFQKAFEGLPEDRRPRVGLLTGSTRKKARTELAAELVSGEVSVLVGTHAIIEDHVAFDKLGLVIIDEQHRFGVHQRGLLMQKAHGWTPHVLSMTATPIPKTLNHVVHGDLDVSIIDEKPPGRVEIETRLYGPADRRDAYRLVRQEIENGHQVFVICPLVEETPTEESEDSWVPPSESARTKRDAKAAVNEAERLQTEVFPDLRIGVLHGQMPSKKKDEVMTAFRAHEFDILVATSVIEVGIDVPNATVVMIEGADRFGLSQLHQLRGRVGRGKAKSYCLLLAEETSAVAHERLEAMVATNDGFVLAQKDLELRGPGDFIGTRQSGMPEMDWIGTGFDSRLLDQAHTVAENVLANDPATLGKRYPQLAEQVQQFWRSTESLDTTKA